MDFLRDLERRLDLPPAEKEQVLREMEAHYHEVVEECLAAGMDEAAAAREAIGRMGDPGHLAARLQTVHGRATWRSALLAAVPVLGVALAGLGPGIWDIYLRYTHRLPDHSPPVWVAIPGILIGVVLLAVSLRELRADRRPIWAAAWLAGGMAIAPVLAFGIPGMHSMPQWQWGNALPAAVVGAVGVWAFWRTPAWRVAAALLAACCAVLASMPHALPFSGYRVGAHFAIFFPTVIAVQLFARHPYGNVSQASLFLFTYYLCWPSGSTDVWRDGALEWYLGSWSAHALIAAVAVVLAARAATQRGKVTLLVFGGLLTSLVTLVLSEARLPAASELALVTVTVSLFLLTTLVLGPRLLLAAARRIRRA